MLSNDKDKLGVLTKRNVYRINHINNRIIETVENILPEIDNTADQLVGKTLVILSPGFPASEADTTFTPPQQVFLKALKANYPDLDIVILTLEYPHERRTYQWFGMEVIAFGGRHQNRLPRLRNWARVWQTLSRLNRHKKIIGLLSFWFDECAFIGHYFARRHRLKHYSWILGQDARPGNRYFKWVKPRPESLIALSDFIARETDKNYGVRPAHIITTGIDTSIFERTTRAKDIDILGVGSLIPLKQFDVFIEVVRFVKEFVPDIHTVICGTGPEHSRLLGMVSYYGLWDNITIVGELPHTQVLHLMQRSKILLHTSNYEGFGAVLLEALYSGAQVVSFVKPMETAMDHHYVVNDMTEMCHRLLDLLQNQSLDHRPVLSFAIKNVADSMMRLFAYRAPASS